MRQHRILLSAYACEPASGSEPGVGWNLAIELAKNDEIWVLTRSANRGSIEAKLGRKSFGKLHFVYFDLPAWLKWWKRGPRGLQLYYVMWQIGAFFVAKSLHQRVGFDLAHHVTFVRYWTPSFISMLPIPFVWGPVGGKEPAPLALMRTFGFSGLIYEYLRKLALFLSDLNPFVALTARKSSVCIATSPETAAHLRKLGARKTYVICPVGFAERELDIRRFSAKRRYTDCTRKKLAAPIRFISIGRMLHWKGFHLAIKAFARADLKNAEYWLVGNGPQAHVLKNLALTSGVASRVRFLGVLQRKQMLKALAEADVLVHPSIHDPGPTVIVEAMALGKPVICLDIGGPGLQVTENTGIKVPAGRPHQVKQDLANALHLLATESDVCNNMGEVARRRARDEFSWRRKAQVIRSLYAEALGATSTGDSRPHQP